MKLRISIAAFVTLSCGAAGLVQAEAVKDREGAVRQDRAKMESDARWIYNDFERGFAEARRTGKPLLVVMRCVPCMSCMGLDASVLEEAALSPLLDQFTCVRVINANAIDLSKFQFDYDLSFSTLFFNGDGTLYGRYGSWTHQKDPLNKATQGYVKALEAALTVHQAYPGNKASLAGKQGKSLPFQTPVEIPMLGAKYERELNWSGQVVKSCVHCHMVGDAFRTYFREQKKPIPLEWIYPMPAPETIGLTLAADQVARIDSVDATSLAASAGLKAGDDIVSVNDQPLISVADFAWVLHNTGESGTLTAVVRRNGSEQSLHIDLPSGWRWKTDNSKRVAAWPMRGMAAGGLVMEDLDDATRNQRGLSADQMALWVKGLGQFGMHGAAKKAGFQKEDVLVEIDGMSARMTESELLGRLLQKRFPGESVAVTVLRGSSRVTLKLPMQ